MAINPSNKQRCKRLAALYGKDRRRHDLIFFKDRWADLCAKHHSAVFNSIFGAGVGGVRTQYGICTMEATEQELEEGVDAAR